MNIERKQEKKQKEGEKEKGQGVEPVRPNRREAIALVAAAAGAATVGTYFSRDPHRTQVEEFRREAEEADHLAHDPPFFKREPRPKFHDTSMFWKKKWNFQRPLSIYVGITGFAEEKTMIDFAHQLGMLWEKGYEAVKTAKPDYAREVVPAIRFLFDRHVEHPVKKKYIEYRNEIDGSLDPLEGALEPNESRPSKVLESLGFRSEQGDLFKILTSALDSNFLLAYAETELVRQDDVDASVVLDFLLQEAGTTYVEAIPDLTQRPEAVRKEGFALGLYALSNKHLESAGVMNKLLPSPVSLPPNSVTLRGTEHHLTAILDAWHNIALLVKDLGEVRSKAINTGAEAPFFRVAIQEFVVASHRDPGAARRAFLTYADNLLVRSSTSVNAIALEYYQCCEGEVQKDVIRFRKNAIPPPAESDLLKP